MIKYVAVAAALKLASTNSITKRAYRAFGNFAGNRARTRQSEVPEYYRQRIGWKFKACHKHEILRPGDWILEVGTGWMHWEAITLRLFFNIRAVLFDVWDCRQLPALRAYFRQLDFVLDSLGLPPEADLGRAHALLAQILRCRSFPELYDLLGF